MASLTIVSIRLQSLLVTNNNICRKRASCDKFMRIELLFPKIVETLRFDIQDRRYHGCLPVIVLQPLFFQEKDVQQEVKNCKESDEDDGTCKSNPQEYHDISINDCRYDDGNDRLSEARGRHDEGSHVSRDWHVVWDEGEEGSPYRGHADANESHSQPQTPLDLITTHKKSVGQSNKPKSHDEVISGSNVPNVENSCKSEEGERDPKNGSKQCSSSWREMQSTLDCEGRQVRSNGDLYSTIEKHKEHPCSIYSYSEIGLLGWCNGQCIQIIHFSVFFFRRSFLHEKVNVKNKAGTT